MTPELAARARDLDDVQLGRRVRAHREEAGLSQVELAALVAISSAHLSRIETGGRRPSEQLLDRIAAALRVDLEVLLEEGFFDAQRRYDLAIEVAGAASAFVNAIGDQAAFGKFLGAVRAWDALAAE